MRLLLPLALPLALTAALAAGCSQITHRGVAIPPGEPLAVAEAQRFLNVAGYPSGPVDGIKGPLTDAALEAFAVDNGLGTGSQITAEGSTLLRRQALRGTGDGGSLAALAASTRFVSVSEAQEQLAALGYRPGPVDGILGPRTRAAIKRFERDTGRPETGALTPETAEALRAAVPAE